MTRLAMLGAILLWTVAAVAQSQANPSTSIQGSQRETTVQGCLDFAEQHYTLTLPSGAIFELTGNTAPLKAHVGEAMQIRGIATPVMNEPGAMSEGEQTHPTLSVTSFQPIAGACTAVNNSLP